MTNLNQQVAVITGAGSGIGRACAVAFSKKGITLALLDLDAEGLKETLLQVNATTAKIYMLDIVSENEMKTVIEEVEQDFNRIDILINCAGITGQTNKKSHETDLENLRKIMDVNFFGSYLSSKYVLPIMLKNSYGRILHISSISGKEGNEGMLGYSASKAAVIAMAKVQGKEYAGTGITINALAPSVIQTPLVDALPQAQIDYMLNKVPAKRLCTLEEAVNMIAFIVSPENSFTTGFTFDLSGGRATY